MRARNLLLVVFVAVFLRAVNLDTIPLWDWDEGANLNIAMHLAEGRAQWFALKFPFVPHPPLYFILAAAYMKVFGASVLSLRMLAVILEVATIIVIYRLGSELFGEDIGLLAGIVYAVYPVSVYWSRMGMVNHLIVLLSVCSLSFFHRFLRGGRERDILFAAFLAGLCPVTGFIGFSAVLAVWYLTWRYGRKYFPLVAAATLLPIILFVAYELYAMPSYFIPEVAFQLTRLKVSPERILVAVVALFILRRMFPALSVFFNSFRMPVSESPALGIVVISLYALVLFRVSDSAFYHGFTDYLTYILIVGFVVKPLFFVGDERAKTLIVSYFAGAFLMLVVMDRADHMTMVTYPYLALAGSHFMARAYKSASGFLAKKNVRHFALAAAVLVYHPVALGLAQSLGIAFGLTVGVQDVPSVLAVADYVNGLVGSDGVVIAYSWMTHLIRANVCVVGQSAAYDGHQILYYSGAYPKDRFAFNCSFRNADAVVLTGGSIEAMRPIDGFSELLSGISGWERREVSGCGVYMNPDKTCQEPLVRDQWHECI